MLVAVALCTWLDRAGVLAAIGVASFASLCAACKGRWTEQGGWGVANSLTALRVAGTAAVAVVGPALSGPVIGLMIGALFLLDGVDGWLARRLRTAGIFGAHLDMEADAFFVLVVTILAWQIGGLGPWVVSAGLLRYAYVLCLRLVPARQGALPRSRFGRLAFAVFVSGLIGVWFLPAPWAALPAACGAAALWLSFIRGFRYSYASINA